MGLAQKLTFAESVKPLTLFRYLSFSAVGTMIDVENAIENGLEIIAAKAGRFTKSDYQFLSLSGSANSIEAAS